MPRRTELPVLLIEDEPDAARLIEYILAKGGAPVEVEWARDLGAGLERLTERRFQAVLLDLNLPDSKGFDTFARVRQSARDEAVIVLTGHEDEALALQTVRAGADDYLLKSDIRDRFLAQRIRYAVERSRLRGQQSGKTITIGDVLSFIGAKGGVGTTTLVLNLAAAIAHSGKTVIAIELVPEYGSFSTLLNRAPSWDISTLLRGAPDTISRETVTVLPRGVRRRPSSSLRTAAGGSESSRHAGAGAGPVGGCAYTRGLYASGCTLGIGCGRRSDPTFQVDGAGGGAKTVCASKPRWRRCRLSREWRAALALWERSSSTRLLSSSTFRPRNSAAGWAARSSASSRRRRICRSPVNPRDCRS